jgi:hypothetical protein
MHHSTTYTGSNYDTSPTDGGTANTCSACMTTNDFILVEESPTDVWNRFFREQEEYKRQVEWTAFIKRQEQKRTFRNWWFNSFKQKPTLYYRPQPNRVTFYKILTCNRKGIGLRNRIRR